MRGRGLAGPLAAILITAAMLVQAESAPGQSGNTVALTGPSTGPASVPTTGPATRPWNRLVLGPQGVRLTFAAGGDAPIFAIAPEPAQSGKAGPVVAALDPVHNHVF